MPVSSGGMIAPFADEAMRLLRETWANPTMLAEEVFAILQQKIPQRASTLNVVVNDGANGGRAPAITMQQMGDGPFILMLDRFGHEVAQIDGRGKLRPADPAKSAPSRTLPTIIWANPDDITSGTALSGTQLNAVAVIPDTAIEIDGVYEYNPDDGTVLSVGDNQPLSVNFTPTNQAAYKRARKTVAINVTAPALVYESSFANDGASPVSRNIAVVAGDLVIVFVGNSGLSAAESGATYTITDNQANAYTQIGTTLVEDYPAANHIVMESYWAKVATTGTLSVTAMASIASFCGLTVHRISGQDSSSPIRDFATHTAHLAAGTSATTGPVGGSAGDMIVANFLPQFGVGMTPIAPYTNGAMVQATAGFPQRHENIAAGSESATATRDASSTSYLAIAVAIAKAP